MKNFSTLGRSVAVLLLLAAAPVAAQAQTGGVRVGTAGSPDASAALDVSSTTKGLLAPRLTATQRAAIASPAAGLLVYQTDGVQPGFWYYAASGGWTFLNPVGVGDNLGNHTATQNLNLGTNRLVGNGGTTGLAISNSGNVGIGTTAAPVEKLEIKDGSIQLTATGPTAVGISNGSGSLHLALAANAGEYSNVAQPGDAVLRTNGGKRLILAGRDGGSVLVSSGAAGAEAERLRVTPDGNVGIGTPIPGQKLDVAGNTNVTGNSYVSGNVGIGTTTATQKLDVNGGILARGSGLIGNQGAHLQWNRSGGLGETWLLNQSGLGSGGIFFGASNSVSSGSNTVTEWARFDSNGDLGLGTRADPAASALLELASTTKGFLPPRMSQTQRDAIGSPATGLTIYNTTTNKLNTWNGTRWTESLSATEQPTQNGATTFAATGAAQTYTVPAGVTRLAVSASGAQGGSFSFSNSYGGQGAQVQTTLAVVPGEVLTVYVGTAGSFSSSLVGQSPGGFNGGGAGARGVGAGGGGATDLRRGTTKLVVAAGGGGAAYLNGGNGGSGGAPNGATGTVVYYGGAPGTGATQTAGGSAGGSLGQGGQANAESSGGGGGGYYGGGGAGLNGGTAFPTAGAGGGGSSWVTPSSLNTAMTAGANPGNGTITLSPAPFYVAPPLDGSNFTSVASANGLLARGADIINEQGAHLQWNRSGFQGETWLLNQNGGGPGGIRFGQSDASNSVTEWSRFDNNGRLGIGTTSPIAPLHVKGAATASTSGGGFSFFSPGSGLSVTGTSAGVNKAVTAYFEGGEVWVSGYIVASSLQATSDRRIKRVIGLSDRASDLALLNRLRITDYTYIDQINNTPGVVKKVIAQEVEQVLPTAVTRSTQALPNVFERATRVSYANGQVTVSMAKPHDLPATGGRMRFYTPANASLDPEVTVVDAHTVRFASLEAHAAGLFVYGKYVDDFRSVDYDALAMLNVSATQELARKVAALEQQNAALQARTATTEAKAAAAEAAAATDKAQTTATLESLAERLRALEAGGGSYPVVQAHR